VDKDEAKERRSDCPTLSTTDILASPFGCDQSRKRRSATSILTENLSKSYSRQSYNLMPSLQPFSQPSSELPTEPSSKPRDEPYSKPSSTLYIQPSSQPSSEPSIKPSSKLIDYAALQRAFELSTHALTHALFWDQHHKVKSLLSGMVWQSLQQFSKPSIPHSNEPSNCQPMH
jgi:hypothetical protein